MNEHKCDLHYEYLPLRLGDIDHYMAIFLMMNLMIWNGYLYMYIILFLMA